MGTFCATQSQSQAWIPAPKCCLSVSPGVCSPAWLPGLASRQLQGHEEDRQTLAAAQGGSHSQEGARENREDRLPSCSPQMLDVHPTAEGSAWGEEAEAAPNGKGGRPRSRDTLQQWHRDGRVDESWSGAGCRYSSIGQQPMGLWLTQWSTGELHPVQPLPTLNSNITSILQIPTSIFPGRIFSWSQTSAAL